MRRLLVSLTIAVAASLAACGGGDSDLWPQTAGETTCTEWLKQMTPDQRTGLAAALLANHWNRAGAGATPGPDLNVAFANLIGSACTGFPEETINVVSASVYPLATDLQP